MKRHLGFGSTPNFKNLRYTLESHAIYNWLADNGYDPVEEMAKEELPVSVEYMKLDLPILTFTGTEKVHGTNMAVCLTGNDVWVQNRNKIVTPGKDTDQDGMAQYVADNLKAWTRLLYVIVADGRIDLSTHTIVIDCEWAGGKIMNGNASCSGTDKAAYIFKYFRVVSNKDDSSEYFPFVYNVNAEEGMYKLSSFGLSALTIDFNDPEKAIADLKILAEHVEDNSEIAKFYGKLDNVGEGVYLTAWHGDELLRLKTKGDKHGGKPKVKRENYTVITDKDAKAIDDLAQTVTPEWRLNQAIRETGATSEKHTGLVIKWMIDDIRKEEEPTMREAGLEFKQIQGTVVSIIKEYFFDSLLKR